MIASTAARGANPLSRTSSASSVSSVDTQASSDDVSRDGDTPRRTRKRFTSAQLMALENLFHQTSHPTREQREGLAEQVGIDLRAVTVWFQNKRQTERKVALHNTTNDCTALTNASTPFPSMHSMGMGQSPQMFNASASHPPLSASPSLSSISSTSLRTVRSHTNWPQLSDHRRPSLDHIASRSERVNQIIRTPTRHRTQSSPNNSHRLFDNMPSSPLSPTGDRDRVYIDFAMRKKSKTKPTLEWACAAASMSTRRQLEEGDIEPSLLDMGGDTEDENDLHEAITPNSSAGRDAKIWEGRDPTAAQDSSIHLLMTPKAKRTARPKITTADADVMDAALALCGLGSGFTSSIAQ
ncbi:hypothetical protein BC835DRAFT_1415341 [Cytidiella melzeri]|nr:hypothetical protein BC835DRAFT_1415341 [Cytidiella melzeri]